MQEAVVYLDSQDALCQQALAFLREHGVECVVKDVRDDPGLYQDLHWMGAQSLPTIVVNGVAVEGFRPETLIEVLGL